MQCAFLRVRSLEQPPRVLTFGTNQRNKYTKRRNGYLFDRTRVPEIQGVLWEEQRGYRTQSKNSLSLFPHWNPAILYLCWSRDFVVCVSICLPPPSLLCHWDAVTSQKFCLFQFRTHAGHVSLPIRSHSQHTDDQKDGLQVLSLSMADH